MGLRIGIGMWIGIGRCLFVVAAAVIEEERLRKMGVLVVELLFVLATATVFRRRGFVVEAAASVVIAGTK